MQRRDTLATALVWSVALHLLVGVAAHRWWLAPLPRATIEARSTMILSLVPNPATSIQPQAVRPGEARPGAARPGEPRPRANRPAANRESTARQSLATPADDVRAAVPPAVNLNPVPQLSEPFELELATLALRQPMAPQQRAALEMALNQVAAELPPWTDESVPQRWHDGEVEYTLQRQAASGATALEHAVLQVNTVENGLALQAEVPVTRLAFSHFAQVVDRWNPEVDLSGDRIEGRFHSNSPLYVSAQPGVAPLVTGPASVAGRVIVEGRARRADIFASGLETRARRISLPRQPLDPQAFSAGERLHRVDASGRVVFLAEGGYRWQPAAGGAVEEFIQPTAYPWLIQAAEGVELEVEGEVRGSLLVYSPRRISVTGNLRYARDPRRGPSADFLGLVSDANVEVAAPDLTGPGDIDIHAAIFARGQFRVRRYNSRDGGVLRVLGSVTAGTLSATEPRFRTVVEYDRRLEQQRPAHFPMTDRYRIDAAELMWTVAGGPGRGSPSKTVCTQPTRCWSSGQ